MFLGMTKIGAGLLAATLTLGGGTAAVTAAHAAKVGRAANPDRQAVCQDYQSKLAQDLHITDQQLLDARKQAANQVIDDQLAAGKITADQAQKAHDRVNNATGDCSGAGLAAVRGQVKVQIGKVELQAVAQQLKITEKELVTEMRGGKSLAQVAQAHNVSRDDLKATMRTAFKGQLDQAVQHGKLTVDQETKALAAFDARIDQLIDRVGKAK
jgi:transposase-like protein